MSFTYRHTKYAAYLGLITQAIVNNLMPLLFVSFQNDFSLGLEKISLLITANFGVQIAVDLLGAKYIDRIGYRPSVVAGHLTVVLGLMLMSFLPFVIEPFTALCICSTLCAIGGGMNEVIISPVVEALPGDEKASAMSMLHSFYCWGQVSVIALSTLYFCTAGIQNWRYLPVIWTLIPLVNTFLFALVPIRTLSEDAPPMPLGKLFKVKLFFIFILVMICSGAAEQSMSQWASLFAEKGLNVSKTLGDLLGPCAFAVLMGLSRTYFGLKGEKLDLTKSICMGSVLCIISYFTASFSPYPILGLIGCAICGLSVGIMWPGTLSLASKMYPKGGTAMFAVLALAGDIGCSAGPAVCGFVADGAGSIKTGLLTAIIFPTVLLICATVLRREKQ